MISENDVATLMKGANRLGAAGIVFVVILVGVPTAFLWKTHQSDKLSQEIYNLEQQILQTHKDTFYSDQFAKDEETAKQQKAIYRQQREAADLRLRSIRK